MEWFTEFTRFFMETMPDKRKTREVRPERRTGHDVPCKVCGKFTYHRASQIARGVGKTCGAPECISAANRGAGNPFWGKTHSPETIARIEATKRARPTPQRKGGLKNKGRKHTAEARAKMSAALRERWRVNRDKMLLNNPPKNKPREEQRYRVCFTPWQRENWTDSKCLWCDSTDDLALDHIIPVMCGGVNERKNAQTLCQTCNMWKMKHVDRPLFLAGLGNQGGQLNQEVEI